MMTRLGIQRILGAIWLFDGLLQLRPAMFTTGFLRVNVASNIFPGQLPWINHVVRWEISLAHPVWLFNLMIIILQVGIGTALLLNWKLRWILSISIGWGLLVWLFGEGLGNILAHQWSLSVGAPGAALLYVLIAVIVWPVKDSPKPFHRWSQSIAVTASAIGWLLSAFEAWVYPVATTGFGGVEAKLFSIACLLAAILLLLRPTRTIGAVALLLLALTAWIFMQEAGMFWLTYATDINSGGLWALLALSILQSRTTPNNHKKLSQESLPVISLFSRRQTG